MSPFKANYSYILKTLLILRQAKKMSETAQGKMGKFMKLY